jgi:hypothetical protein
VPRLVAAFVLAPLVGLLVIGAITQTLELGRLAAIVAYPIALVFGVPAFLFLRRRGWLRWWQVTLGGAACAVPFMAIYLFMSEPDAADAAFLDSLYLLACGAAIGLAFWALGVLRNRAMAPKQ